MRPRGSKWGGVRLRSPPRPLCLCGAPPPLPPLPGERVGALCTCSETGRTLGSAATQDPHTHQAGEPVAAPEASPPHDPHARQEEEEGEGGRSGVPPPILRCRGSRGLPSPPVRWVAPGRARRRRERSGAQRRLCAPRLGTEEAVEEEAARSPPGSLPEVHTPHSLLTWISAWPCL